MALFTVRKGDLRAGAEGERGNKKAGILTYTDFHVGDCMFPRGVVGTGEFLIQPQLRKESLR